MPIRLTRPLIPAAEAQDYESPFLGPVDHLLGVKITLSALTSREIDAQGYLKPGIPFLKTGALVTAGAVYGVTVEEVKVAEDNAPATIAALVATEVALALEGTINRAVAEDMLGAPYTAPELAGFIAASSQFVLIF